MSGQSRKSSMKCNDQIFRFSTRKQVFETFIGFSFLFCLVLFRLLAISSPVIYHLKPVPEVCPKDDCFCLDNFLVILKFINLCFSTTRLCNSLDRL